MSRLDWCDSCGEFTRPLVQGLCDSCLEAPSECGDAQARPTGQEIRGCPEIIVRVCSACGHELWWNGDEWRRLVK
jgi:hypothetical protein